MDLYLQLNDGYIYFILYNQYLPPLWLGVISTHTYESGAKKQSIQ